MNSIPTLRRSFARLKTSADNLPAIYCGSSSGTGTWSTNAITWTTTSTTSVNIYWNTSTTGTNWPERVPYSQASLEEQQNRDREHRERINRQAQERQQANERAQTLLLSFLSAEQREQFERDGYFHVIGSAGGRYRIRRGSVGNIDWYHEGGNEWGGSLCCHPMDAYLPPGDIMLAQMLALTTDEPGFVRLANRHTGARHPLARRERVGV